MNLRSMRGFGLFEAILGAGLLGILVLGVMSTMTQSIKLTERAGQSETLYMAMESLLEEIRGRAFEDPIAPGFGPEVGEIAAVKTTFDDVDDFCNYSEPIALDSTGAPNPAFAGIVLSAKVWYLPANDVDGRSDTDASSANDNGRIDFDLDAPAPVDPCATPGAVSRFKAIEVRARSDKHANPGDNVAPYTVRTIRFE